MAKANAAAIQICIRTKRDCRTQCTAVPLKNYFYGMRRPDIRHIFYFTNFATARATSIIASARPVTVLVAPGPEVTIQTPGRPLTRA